MVVRIPDPSLIILCGPAGSGKTTFALRHFPATAVVSSDRCRAMIADDESNIGVSRDAFELFHQIIGTRLKHRRLTVADSTALQPDARKALRQIARRWDVPVTIILFDVSEETAHKWDERRQRRVGRPVIRRQWDRFQPVLRDASKEGYDRVVILGEEDISKTRVEITRSETKVSSDTRVNSE